MKRHRSVIAAVAVLWVLSCAQLPPATHCPIEPVVPPASRPNIITNGNFENGMKGWSSNHNWYAGRGKGVSAWSCDDNVFHSGARSAKLVGAANRGIVMQVFKTPPATFHVEGWIKTDKLDAGSARIVVEFIDGSGKYICGTSVGDVKGTSDWTRVRGPVTAPDGAASCHFDLLTTEPNNGAAWFDDVVIRYEPLVGAPPAPARFQVNAKPADLGTLNVTWEPADGAQGIYQYNIYMEEKRFSLLSRLHPRMSVDWTAREAVIGGVKDGKRYWVAVVPVDLNGRTSPEVQPVDAIARDTMPPHPPTVHVEEVLSPDGAALVSWDACSLDRDAVKCCIQISDKDVCEWSKEQMKTFPIPDGSAVVGGLGTGKEVIIAVGAMDEAGNVSPPVCARVKVPLVRTRPSGSSGISGVVHDAAGRPIPGATVWAEGPAGDRVQAHTDGSGKFAITKLPAELVRLGVCAVGFAEPRRLLVSPQRQEVQMAMSLQPSSEVPLDVWVASSLDNVFKDTPPPAKPSRAIDLLCARNETECAQIVLRPKQKVGGVSVEFSSLSGPRGAVLPPQTGSASFVGFIHVDKNSKATPKEELLRSAPADFPDPFLEDRSIVLAPGENQPIFIRYAVPADAKPGAYEGSIRVLYESGQEPPAQISVPVKIEVMPFALPKTCPLFVTNWFSIDRIAKFHNVELWSEGFWTVLREYARELRRCHQTVVIVPLNTVRIVQEDNGSLTYDFELFDRWVKLFEEEGVAERIEIMHLGSRETGEWECPTFVLHPRPVTVRATGAQTTLPAEQFAAAVQAHVEKKGWLKKTVLHIADEPIPKNVASWCEISNRVHDAAPKLKRIDAIHVPYESLKGCIELPVPQLNYFDKWCDGYRAAQQAGEIELWFYIAWVPQGKYTNRLIDTACIKTRLIHWINFIYGATGYLHWGLNFWTDFKNMGYSPGDNWIIYPGATGPRSSLRWEAQRDGLEDYMYFHLLAERCAELEKRGKPAPAGAMDLAKRVMKGFTDYDKNPATLEAVRRDVARAIVEADARLK